MDEEAFVALTAPHRRALHLHCQAAWAAVDIDAMVSLLAPDAVLAMPPEAARFDGAPAIGEFLVTVPLEGQLDRITLVPARANGQPATAAYAEDEDGVPRAYGVMLFAIAGDRIAGITGFAQRPELFVRLGLPTELSRRSPGSGIHAASPRGGA